jgi:hypothetical protein
MFDIFDGDGNNIGAIELSEKQQRLLEDDGASVVTIFHTPRMLQHVLGNDSGSFEISRKSADRLVVRPDSLPALRRYIAMQVQIKKMQGTP